MGQLQLNTKVCNNNRLGNEYLIPSKVTLILYIYYILILIIYKMNVIIIYHILYMYISCILI